MVGVSARILSRWHLVALRRRLLLTQHLAPFHEFLLLLLEEQGFHTGQKVVRPKAALSVEDKRKRRSND